MPGTGAPSRARVRRRGHRPHLRRPPRPDQAPRRAAARARPDPATRAAAAARRRRRRAAARSGGAWPTSSESTDRVRFLGYRRDLTAIAAAADVAVLSSANEGTPVSLIEAAAAGSPGGRDRRRRRRRRGYAGDRDPRPCRATPEAVADALVRLADRSRVCGPGMGAAASERALRRYSAARLSPTSTRSTASC